MNRNVIVLHFRQWFHTLIIKNVLIKYHSATWRFNRDNLSERLHSFSHIGKNDVSLRCKILRSAAACIERLCPLAKRVGYRGLLTENGDVHRSWRPKWKRWTFSRLLMSSVSVDFQRRGGRVPLNEVRVRLTEQNGSYWIDAIIQAFETAYWESSVELPINVQKVLFGDRGRDLGEKSWSHCTR